MTEVQAVTPALDVYGLASRLLDLVVDGYGSRDVALPDVKYVSPGALPAYDGAQITVNIRGLTDGRAGGGLPASVDPYTTLQYVDLAVAVVRDVPSDPNTGGFFRELTKATKAHLDDINTLRAVLVDIREQQLLVDNSTPMLISPMTTEGPEGGVVAVLAIVSLSYLSPQPWLFD